MLITKKAIPRRTMLKGLGATLALPLLDAMVPPLTALQKTAANPVTRFGVMYVPNGMVMNQWTPVAEGANFELTPTLAPLAPLQERPPGVEQPGLCPDAGPSGWRARQGEHAVPHRRVAADERDMARCGHLDRSDHRPQDERVHAARLARTGRRIRRNRRRLRCRLRLRLHQHDLLAGSGNTAADGEQSPDRVRAFVWRQREHRSPWHGRHVSVRTRASSIR